MATAQLNPTRHEPTPSAADLIGPIGHIAAPPVVDIVVPVYNEATVLDRSVMLGALPAGTYFLRFEQDGGLWTTRFVKL